ncbi:hypothetical protein AN642_02615 [Epulopiscium sp. SCG-B10WGA-EpuloA2]|nr:hypothetical protein AN642_02615 [Epulopiscium sp. SCG-B10WGA-EpuloA2]
MINTFRAPTDNEIEKLLQTGVAGYNRTCLKMLNTNASSSTSGAKIEFEFLITAIFLQAIIWKLQQFIILKITEISVVIHMLKKTPYSELPRFGVRLFLDKNISKMLNIRRMDHESYIDKHITIAIMARLKILFLECMKIILPHKSMVADGAEYLKVFVMVKKI